MILFRRVMKILWLLIPCFFALAYSENFKDHIHFLVYTVDPNVGPLKNSSTSVSRNPIEMGWCSAGDLLAVTTHGWRESCEVDWMIDLLSNLTVHRTGCIICMDYSYYAADPTYVILRSQFDQIKEVLHQQLLDYNSYGFPYEKMFLFGMSFGAHLILQGALAVGEQVIEEIDVCDPAGPGFELMPSAMLSAKNVQTIHTSLGIGTGYRTGHQNWDLGICGIVQGLNPVGSHILCPHMYNSAFTHVFQTEDIPLLCVATLLNAATNEPEDYRMGYKERRKYVRGSLWTPTTRTYPYNQSE